jgi:hypothetical protein
LVSSSDRSDMVEPNYPSHEVFWIGGSCEPFDTKLQLEGAYRRDWAGSGSMDLETGSIAVMGGLNR